MNTRTGALSGSATEIKTPVPGDCHDEFTGLRSAGILGEEFAVGAAPLGSVAAPPHGLLSWRNPSVPTQCHLPPVNGGCMLGHWGVAEQRHPAASVPGNLTGAADAT